MHFEMACQCELVSKNNNLKEALHFPFPEKLIEELELVKNLEKIFQNQRLEGIIVVFSFFLDTHTHTHTHTHTFT